MPEFDDVVTTRAAYDTVADSYARLLRDHLDDKPFDRAMLTVFAELVLGQGGREVLDAGCGPGLLTPFLRDLGLRVQGVDLSASMIAIASAQYPGTRFRVGSLESLPTGDASFDGVVSWYSIIHTPPERRPSIFGEIRRVLRASGFLVLAFQLGTGSRRVENAYGHDVALDAYLLDTDDVRAELEAAGFDIESTLVRGADAHERLMQGVVIARRAARSS